MQACEIFSTTNAKPFVAESTVTPSWLNPSWPKSEYKKATVWSLGSLKNPSPEYDVYWRPLLYLLFHFVRVKRRIKNHQYNIQLNATHKHSSNHVQLSLNNRYICWLIDITTNPRPTSACYNTEPLSDDGQVQYIVQYGGQVSETVRGETCMKWTSNDPHVHDRFPENFPHIGRVSLHYLSSFHHIAAIFL